MKIRPYRHAISCFVLCVIALLAVQVQSAAAQTQTDIDVTAAPPAPQASLTVATKIAPPFAMQTDDGKWSGLAIELFEEIAQNLKREVVWTTIETSDGLVDAVAKGQADAAIAAVTITGEREKVVDFSHAYYDSGLSIAVASNHASGIWDVMRALASPAFLTTVSMLVLLLFITGAIVWFIEKDRNSAQFQKEPVEGIGNGFWWAAVTMTTVGYGDKAPVTPLGRAIAVVWMFAALILTAVFTAQLTAALTLEGIAGPVTTTSDLPRARVGIVEKSATAEYFQKRFIHTHGFHDVNAGLKALENGRIDAFVHDEPILRYSVLRDYQGRIELLPEVFEKQGYGIVLAPDSNLRETVNQALLDVQATARWSSIKRRYLGEDQ